MQARFLHCFEKEKLYNHPPKEGIENRQKEPLKNMKNENGLF
jgi:hypothetical protein